MLPHLSPMTWGASSQLQNYYSETAVTGHIKIGNCSFFENLGKVTKSLLYRGTKDYTVSVSENENGPWTTIKSGTFSDPTKHSDGKYNPQTTETFDISPTAVVQYVKFTCTSFYKYGCVLQYIGVQ